MQLSAAIDALILATRAVGRSQRTIEGYQRQLGYLNHFLGDPEIEAITTADLRRYAAHLHERTHRFLSHPNTAPQAGGLARDSIASYLRSVKRLFAWLTAEELLQRNPAAGLLLPRPPAREPKAYDTSAFIRMVAATLGDAPTERRDCALLLFLADTGCRVGGLSHLCVDDVNLAQCTARLVEKGNRVRTVPFSPLTADALAAWLAVRPPTHEHWLFLNLGTRRTEERLTEDAIGEVLRRLKRRANVQGRANPHSFRHGFAREWLRAGGDLGSLSQLLGHSDPSITLRFYSRFAPSELHEAHERYGPVRQLLGVGAEEEDDGMEASCLPSPGPGRLHPAP